MKTVLRRLSIKQRVFLCMVLLSLVPQLMLVTRMFNQNRETLVSATRDSTYQLVCVSNELLNDQMRLVGETTRNILIDEELYNIFATGGTPATREEAAYYTFSGLTETDTQRSVRKTLFKYFGNYSIVAQVDVVTPGECYYMNSRTTNYGDFWQSEICQEIQDANGGIVWLGNQEMRPYRLEQNYLSCARLMNLTYVQDSGIGHRLPEGSPKPILLVMFSRSYIMQQLEKSIANLNAARYALLDGDGEALLSGGTLPVVLDESALEQIRLNKSGMLETQSEDNRTVIVCYDQLERSGWTSYAAFSVEALTGAMESSMRAMYVGVVALQVATSLLAALIAIRLMVGRIRKVNAAVDEVKAGHYATRITDDCRDEFTPLIGNVNEMSERLRQLVDENLKVRLGEQEARLQTLMAQLNPHYIYNSLNVINWVALRENARRTGALIVALSKMLRYTTNNQVELTCLREDVAWMEQYIMLMNARFEGLFTVAWDVEEECLDQRLPKLFLQPLFENSILHGFADRQSGGVIQARIWRQDGDVYCTVTDNGCGMEPSMAEELLQGKTSSVGLYNIHKRIQLMFGEEYGLSIASAAGQGTRVTVRMMIQS